MAAERLCVREIRNVYRIYFQEGKSQSQIASSVGCGKSTVRDYLKRAKAAGQRGELQTRAPPIFRRSHALAWPFRFSSRT